MTGSTASGPVRPVRGSTALPARTADLLTGLRLALVPVVLVLMARPGTAAALAVLLLGVISDLADGRAARAAGVAGPRGQLFDHGTDCLFVAAALAGAAAAGDLPWLLPVLVVASFGQYVADSWWPGSGPLLQRGLRGNRLGHWNGVAYFVPPFLVLAERFGLPGPPLPDPLPDPLPAWGWAAWLGWALVVTTLVSTGQRLATTRRLLRDRGRRAAGSPGSGTPPPAGR